VNGKPIYYLANQSSLVITSSTHPTVGYLALINCDNMTVQGLTLSDNINGLLMAQTTNSTIKQNTIAKNQNGIWLLLHSDGNTIFGNDVQSNWVGVRAFYSDNSKIIANNMTQNSSPIWLDQSVNNEVSGNTISQSSYETIHLVGSSGNIIYSNNFLGNSIYPNGWSSATDTWNKGYPGGGNYWSSYQGVDLNSGISQGQPGSDGIGDVAYIYVDMYPLIAPVVTCEAGVWDGKALYVELMTNSTISNFKVDKTGSAINFTASGSAGTVGFSRITVPNVIVQNLWNGVPQAILANGQAQTFRNWTDSENTYLYVTYVHQADEIKLIPEFPSSIILYLLMIMMTLVIIIKKRRERK
jgi:parallel beta-helix repeat protein